MHVFQGEDVTNGVHRCQRDCSGDTTEEQLVLGLGEGEGGDLGADFLQRMGKRLLGEHAGLVGRPVFATDPLGSSYARFQHPWHQSEERRSGRDQDHLPVGTRIHQRIIRSGELQHRSIALNVATLDCVGDHRLQTGPKDGGLDRLIHELCLTGQQPTSVSNHGTHHAFNGGVMPRLSDRDPHRASVSVAVEGHCTAHGSERQIGGEMICIRTILTKRREGHVHDAGLDRSNCGEPDSLRFKRARACVLKDKVCGLNKFEQLGAPLARIKVKRDAPLPTIESMEVEAVERPGVTGDQRLVRA